MKTVATKVNNDVYRMLDSECKERGVTVSEKLRELIKNQGKLADSFDFTTSFEHLKTCERCLDRLVDNGYMLVSLEELKKHNLVPKRNSV
ncbi:MAG: hypothetical protein ABI342_04010 [Nitrososphaera sp.]|jgi:predicted CopG family antitoxin